MDVTAGDGREWNYARRGGVAASGAALPDGAANRWENPVLWAGEIERSEHRKDSRLFRDDVIGVPLELVAAGKAYEAIGEYARKISQLRRTPVHFAMHCPPRSDSSNWHAHVVYAGRRLTPDGRSFSPKRDRAQDHKELINEHKAIWTTVCAEYGVELDFSGPVSEQPLAHLGPQAAGIERTAAHRETTDRLVGAIRDAGGEVSDARELSSVAHAAHAGESVTDLVMREGGPATTVGKRAKRPKPLRREVHEHPWIQLGKWSIPAPGPDEFDGVPEPAYTLALAAERPRPRPATVVEAPLVAASELPHMPPVPVRAATRPRPRPAAVVEAPLVAASELPRLPPVPVRAATRPRPRPATVVEAPLVAASELPRLPPVSVRAVTRPRPRPAAVVEAPLVAASELPRLPPVSVRAVTRPRPRPAAVVEAPLVAASELPRLPPVPVRAATRPRPRPAAVVEAPLVAASELPRLPPVSVRAVTRPRPRPAAVVEAPLVAASELPRLPPVPVRAATRPRPRPAAEVEAPLVAASELPRLPPVPVRAATRPRPRPAAEVEAPLVAASELPRLPPVPVRAATRPRPRPAAEVEAPLVAASELPRLPPVSVRAVTRPRPRPAAEVRPDVPPLDLQFTPDAMTDSPELRGLVNEYRNASNHGDVAWRLASPLQWDGDIDAVHAFRLFAGGRERYRGKHALLTIGRMYDVLGGGSGDDGGGATEIAIGAAEELSRHRDLARDRGPAR